MTAPVIVSCQVRGTNLYLIFDRAITATTVTGITATTQPSGVVNALTFVGVSGNTLTATLASGLSTGQSLAVVLVGGSSIRDAATGLDAATPFTKTAVDAYVIPTVVQALAGWPTSTQITLQFSRPVASASGDLVAGFSVSINSSPVVGSITATLSPNQTRLYLAVPSSIGYTSSVSVTYSATTGNLFTQLLPTSHSDGTSVGGIASDTVAIVGVPSETTSTTGTVAGTAVSEVDTFTVAATNVSTNGLPTSGYPLSTVVKAAPVVVSGVVNAQMTLGLNPIDVVLVERYGPVRVAIGGTFGITVETPSGIYAGSDSLVTLVDGVVIKQTFSSGVNPSAAVIAANDWLTTIAGAVSQALGQVRAIDQAVGPLTGSLQQV